MLRVVGLLFRKERELRHGRPIGGLVITLRSPRELATKGQELIVFAEVSDDVLDGDEHALGSGSGANLHYTSATQDDEVLVSRAKHDVARVQCLPAAAEVRRVRIKDRLEAHDEGLSKAASAGLADPHHGADLWLYVDAFTVGRVEV